MVFSVPFLLNGLEGKRGARILAFAGLGAAGLGIFLCGARSPVIILGAATFYSLFSLKFRFSTLFAFAVLGAALYYLVSNSARLQRFETLGDTSYVEARLAGSLNLSLVEAFISYPLGAGLGRAFGTSVPFFLMNYAEPQIGIESEYGHTIIEQGAPGLLILVCFCVWTLRPTRAPIQMTQTAQPYMVAIVAVSWLMGTIGVGLFSSIPGTALLLLLAGICGASPVPEKQRLALRHVGARREGNVRDIGGRRRVRAAP
jgi:hypothetical protein